MNNSFNCKDRQYLVLDQLMQLDKQSTLHFVNRTIQIMSVAGC